MNMTIYDELIIEVLIDKYKKESRGLTRDELVRELKERYEEFRDETDKRLMNIVKRRLKKLREYGIVQKYVGWNGEKHIINEDWLLKKEGMLND